MHARVFVRLVLELDGFSGPLLKVDIFLLVHGAV